MINKQKIWIVTLFSLILVLSVYYITMPEELVASKEISSKEKVSVATENEIIATLKLENDEERSKEITDLQTVLTSTKSTSEEKNNAYEELRELNIIKGKEEEISNKIKENYGFDNFVKIKDDQVRVVIIKKDHSNSLASEIMALVQENFDNKVYVSVKFQK